METRIELEPALAWKLKVVPGPSTSDGQLFYFDNTDDKERIRKELEFILEIKVSLELISPEELKRKLHTLYPLASLNNKQAFRKGVSVETDSIEAIVMDAADLKASDIHIERTSSHGRIRYRIDGRLLERKIISISEYPGLINRVKVKSNISISEKRIPQDGRCFVDVQNKKYDLRVSVVPSVYGEMIVIRILGSSDTTYDLSSIGLTELQHQEITEALRKLQGLILFSGPTGSGKTSTLYACLNELNSKQRNIITIEDPVEITLEGINQVQVKPEVGLTFSSALRAVLRQDPDVIMIGEIRDSETAELAIRASMTGHLVISTIHTNSAWESLSRLSDLGVPSYLLGPTLKLSVAQRLVRKLCLKCKTKDPLTNHYSAAGCESCNMTGYSGRIGSFELISFTGEIRNSISSGDLSSSAKPKYKSLVHSVKELVASGITSGEEALPLIRSFDEE